jgi:hypothetical protein
MNLNFEQATQLMRRIDLRDLEGREVWKAMLHAPVNGTMTEVINHFLNARNSYLTSLLAQLVAERFK